MTEPRVADDDFVVVARAQDQAEGEFLQSLLLRRAPGFDVPEFLSAGPREVLVPAAAEQVARDVLLQTERRDADQ